MSLEADLTRTLQTLCSRVFPDVAPAGTATPYITWQQVGGVPLAYLEGAMPGERNASMQINVWAAVRSEALPLLLSIEATLCARGATPIGGAVALSDDTLNLRGYAQDFSIWAAR